MFDDAGTWMALMFPPPEPGQDRQYRLVQFEIAPVLGGHYPTCTEVKQRNTRDEGRRVVYGMRADRQGLAAQHVTRVCVYVIHILEH